MIVHAMWRSMKSFNCQSSLQILRISSVKFPSFFISEKTQRIDAKEKQNCTVLILYFQITMRRNCHKHFILWVFARTFLVTLYRLFSKEIVQIIVYLWQQIYLSIDYDDPLTSWHPFIQAPKICRKKKFLT